MFPSLFPGATQSTTTAQQPQPTFGALPAPNPSAAGAQSDAHAVCNGAQQRMQAIQSMYSASFLTYSYVLADSQAQIQQVYNAGFQQGVHHDAGKWHEAKVKNPDSQFAYPQPIYGFSSLSERSKQQKSHLNNLIGAADNAKTQVSNLKAHTERIILAELTNCERRNNQLSSQLAKLMLSIELFGLQNCKASVDFGRHRELLEKVEKVSLAVGSLQKKILELKSGQKSIANHSLPLQGAPSSSSFVTLRDSVSRKMDSVYHSVLDRCRAVSAQAMHDRLSSRSKTFLADLKREYISSQKFGKLRTMNSFEIEILKLFSSISDSKEIFALVSQVARQASSPPLFADFWQLIAHLCSAPFKSLSGFLRASVEFLESKFAEEIASVSDPSGKVFAKQMDRKTALFAYCRQRMRAGDPSWIWFAIFCAFRAGWASVISEISMEPQWHKISNLEPICACLIRILEGVASPTDSLTASEDSGEQQYKALLVSICRNEFSGIRISQQIPDCTAFDWIWFGLRSVLSSSPSTTIKSGLIDLRRKVESLPPNYFESSSVMLSPSPPSESSRLPGLVPSSLGPKGEEKSGKIIVRNINASSSKSTVQLALMHTLCLDWGKAVNIALKSNEEVFDINDPFHRFALFGTISLDKFGIIHCVEAENVAGSPLFDPSEIILEAALTIAVVQERNEYASAVSASTSQKIIDQLALLDKRRNAVLS